MNNMMQYNKWPIQLNMQFQESGAKEYCLAAASDKNLDCIYLIQFIFAWKMEHYFYSRILTYTEAGPKNYKITEMEPQDSVLSSLLWNIAYDALLYQRI